MFFQLSFQLFDCRYELHKGACNYAMDLNHLHGKKTPDFLQNLVILPPPPPPPRIMYTSDVVVIVYSSQVDFMTSQFSYFHLGQITVADVRPYMDSTYTIMEVSIVEEAPINTHITEYIIFMKTAPHVELSMCLW